jgi:hypothetical protein
MSQVLDSLSRLGTVDGALSRNDGLQEVRTHFMYNWKHALKDISESVKLATKSESDGIKFNAKDWLKWLKLINNHFSCRLGVRGVTLNWV